MKPRARRVTIAAAVLGAGVVAVLAVANWNTVRDYVEAWRFQLTMETKTIDPSAASNGSPASIEVWPDGGGGHTAYLLDWLQALANSSGLPVIVDYPSWIESVFVRGINTPRNASPVVVGGITTKSALQALWGDGCRVLEQRFPRRAYIVVGDPSYERGGSSEAVSHFQVGGSSTALELKAQ
jgi:hypothetical protein